MRVGLDLAVVQQRIEQPDQGQPLPQPCHLVDVVLARLERATHLEHQIGRLIQGVRLIDNPGAHGRERLVGDQGAGAGPLLDQHLDSLAGQPLYRIGRSGDPQLMWPTLLGNPDSHGQRPSLVRANEDDRRATVFIASSRPRKGGDRPSAEPQGRPRRLTRNT